MNPALVGIFRYNRWANLTLIDACCDLSDEQLDSKLAAASGTLRELLLHIVGGQQTCVLRTMGRQHEGELTRYSPWPGFESLRDIAVRSSDDLISIAESLDADADVELAWRGTSYRFPKSFFLVHAAEHSVEHRTELKLSLAAVGVETPDLDGWAYAAAMGYGQTT